MASRAIGCRSNQCAVVHSSFNQHFLRCFVSLGARADARHAPLASQEVRPGHEVTLLQVLPDSGLLLSMCSGEVNAHALEMDHALCFVLLEVLSLKVKQSGGKQISITFQE